MNDYDSMIQYQNAYNSKGRRECSNPFYNVLIIYNLVTGCVFFSRHRPFQIDVSLYKILYVS